MIPIDLSVKERYNDNKEWNPHKKLVISVIYLFESLEVDAKNFSNTARVYVYSIFHFEWADITLKLVNVFLHTRVQDKQLQILLLQIL